jgi:predicted RNA methylase
MRPKTRELQILSPVQTRIENLVGRVPERQQQEFRLQLLEAAASRIGGFDLDQYRRTFAIKDCFEATEVLLSSEAIVGDLRKVGMHPALAISALAREGLPLNERKSAGQFYTDFRLATYLAERLKDNLDKDSRILDPACGTGILLAAISIAVCGADRKKTAEWLSRNIVAADLSAIALRGARMTLSCLTDDVEAIKGMFSNWVQQDSLLDDQLAWGHESFDAVVANPPWEKVKLTRHEFIQSGGGTRHYGADYDHFDDTAYRKTLLIKRDYGNELAARYDALRHGEPDLYVAFAELACSLVKPGGHIGIILPAGLIRSKGTAALRERLWTECDFIEFDLLDNRSKFFEIDTRFKFLVSHLRKKHPESRVEPISLAYASGVKDTVRSQRPVRIGRESLKALRPDLTVPEVRTESEWLLFKKVCSKGVDWSAPESSWFPKFMREADMTRDRRHFRDEPSKGCVPLVEGRMVHHHRLGAKSYIAGRGRRAEWTANGIGDSHVQPQFWIPIQVLPDRVRERSNRMRAGFCDITGQTNERSCMAAMIPPGHVCGNKVPTLVFPNDDSEDRAWLWLAIANSFPFDWLLRRVITTTVNYFLLMSVPLPPIEPESLPGRRLIEIARKLDQLDRSGSSFLRKWEIAELRAKADSIVANAYGLDQDDLRLMLEDFPLIDRKQPPINNEQRSSVTTDLLLHTFCVKDSTSELADRVDIARRIGATPYLAADYVMTLSDQLQGGMLHEHI